MLSSSTHPHCVVHFRLRSLGISPTFAPMYIKVQTRMRVGEDGKKHACFYPRLYESYRDGDGKVRQRYLLPLDLSDLPSWKDRYAMCHVLNDLVANGPSLNLDDTPVTHKAWPACRQGSSGRCRQDGGDEAPRAVFGLGWRQPEERHAPSGRSGGRLP